MQTGSSQFRYQAVEDHVMGLIDSCVLTPGDKLPSLRKLSARLDASISTITQAYLELERKGVVESRPRSGFYVRAPRRLPTPSSGDGMQAARAVSRTKLINTVLESVGRPDLTPLGIICPSSQELLPGRALARIMASVLREQPHRSLEYETIPGNLELRKQISLLGLDHGTRFAPEDMIVTSGALEALYISLRATTRPGDTVLIMSPTYFCFLQLVETLGLRAIEVSSHPEHGIDPGDIKDALDKYDITASVLCPNFNNPDGSLTPESAKAEIVRLFAQRGVPLVEDDVYGDLHFGNARPRTFKSYDTSGMVILCSSFSKTLAPGYRVGWMVPGRYRDKALEIKATTNVCSASPTQMALGEFLRQGLYDKHLKRLRSAIHKQRDVMLHHVGEQFPEGTRATRPEGGSVLWLELPGGVNCVDYFYEARARGIGVAPGNIFSTQDKFKSFIRLSLGGVWDHPKELGIRELGRLARAMAGQPAGTRSRE
ncbi:MAG: PLP-dependent aminotransferase family protein [Proteobacteria bacterium]|nr:PLP-dependent aminotransferase family protein [Pseudomonadota bacterium]